MIFAIRERMRIIPNSSGSDGYRQAGVCFHAHLPAKERGFTLIEVMIVIVIIGVLTGIALPAFSDWRNNQAVRSASQTLLSQMKQARVLALSENRSVSINFCDGTVHDAWVLDASAPDVTCDPCVTLSCTENMIPLDQFSGSLSLTTNQDPITFFSRGTASNGTVIFSAGNRSQGVTVNIIGRARMQ